MTKKAIFDKKNILVIGGAGFIGSHLCDALIKNNKVICLDNLSTGDEKNIDHLLVESDFAFVRHDVARPINLEKESSLQKFRIQFQGVQEVYNLACPMSPKNFNNNRLHNLLTNSYGVKHALDVAYKYEAKFLHLSSSVVYGPRNEKNKKVKEEDLGKVDFLSPRSSYDEGKRFAETIVSNYVDMYGLDAKILRPFRIFGPRMKLNDNQMIPDFVNDALDNKDLTIFGDKNFNSSFCYITDLLDAMIKIMETDILGPINIGSDMDINLTDLAQKIIKMVDSESKIKYEDPRLFMTQLCLPDINKASEELGWMPVVTLEKGLERTINDLRANKGLKRVGQQY